MKKQYRVKKTSEIEKILKNRMVKSNQYFTVYIKKNPETSNFRYAISVGKKIGNAVIRNRVKRQVRSIIDNMCYKDFLMDVFVVVKPSINNIDYEKMTMEIKYLFKKHNIKIKGE